MLEAYSNVYTRGPSEDGDLKLKFIFAKPLTRLANIENEIRIAERWIQHLRHDKANILQTFERYYPFIRKAPPLPDDILREIFLWCLPTEHNPTMSAKEAPMVLTRISSRWRSVALNTPRLWSALHIAVPNPIPYPHSLYDPTTGERIRPSYILEQRLRAVAEWLEKSGQLPLSLSLYDPDSSSDSGYGKLFVQSILPYASRWRHLSAQCPPDAVADIARLQPSHVPHLESLCILPTPRSLDWKNSGILRASKLREISIYGLLEGFSDLPLKWDQLTHLTMTGGQWLDGNLTMAQIGQILTRCSQLQSCTLKLTGGASISRERHQLAPIFLPKLDTLCIYEMQPQTHFFFAAITAPRLRVLEYWVYGTTKSTPSGFSSLLTKVGVSLQRLSTNPTTIEATEFLKGLWACPALTSLILRPSYHGNTGTYIENASSPTSDILLKSFSHSTNGSYLCPMLNTLECHVGANFSDEAILEFIKRKQVGSDTKISKLKSVKLYMTRGPTMDAVSYLGSHITSSMKLDIRYPPESYRGSFSLYDGLMRTSDPDPYTQLVQVPMLYRVLNDY
ncbi:hypothetical protein HYPSUDRAFT_41010 [Hypholoma sublateritium FD-334 SS-4]|uniref:Uncharacterized protein n=1 Tax=Hypholoma sublateritium (strain FD-334 SS-4) TaxID=945553 RepID=A0A0D2P0Z3_HYPSF|nr:hypothetical protein HYPSUDRAFT_41010 [Hypholoma sublateritium FD-334 SS-4]